MAECRQQSRGSCGSTPKRDGSGQRRSQGSMQSGGQNGGARKANNRTGVTITDNTRK